MRETVKTLKWAWHRENIVKNDHLRNVHVYKHTTFRKVTYRGLNTSIFSWIEVEIKVPNTFFSVWSTFYLTFRNSKAVNYRFNTTALQLCPVVSVELFMCMFLFRSVNLFIFTIEQGLQIYIQWNPDSRTVWCSNKKWEKNAVWNSNKNSKVELWARHCTASCGPCHRESTSKNAASWVLLVGLRIGASISPVISV